MAQLAISLFGSFRVTLNAIPVTGFESARARALLAFLAAESERAHSREAVAEMLWPERAPGSALANLRHTLATLRAAIGDHSADPPFLLITPQTIQFNLASDVTVDLCQFVSMLRSGAAASVPACQDALALYRGCLLDGFSLDGSPDFEAWLVVTRERIDRQAVHALTRLVRYCVEQGEEVQAVRWARRLLDLEPWNEDVHRQLMWLLAHSGQRTAALHQYERCTQMLATELGIAPQPITQALAERIRAGLQDIGYIHGLDGKPLLPASSPVRVVKAHNVPAQPTPFVGRTRELARVADTLADKECRLLTIVGPGGIGKTRLAVASIALLAPRFDGGVWFIDLVPANAAELLPTILLTQLGASEAGPADTRSRLLSYLADKELLLVLDNFEHLVADAGLVTEILAAAPAVKILVTSRVALRLQEEWLVPLAGMQAPPQPDPQMPDMGGKLPPEDFRAPAPVPDLNAFDATLLFLQCARRSQPDFAPAAEEAQQVAQICRQLDGMPLAIELTTSWMRRLPLSVLASEVANGLAHLETPLRGIPDRHRSINAVFDQSWQVLSSHERQVLRALSAFRGGFTADAAAQVAAATIVDLGRLIDASWLRLRTGDRYDMHELVRQYCSVRLHETGWEESAADINRRHCTYFAEYLSRHVRHMNFRKAVMSDLMAEFGNLQEAWQWGIENGEMEIAHDMALGLFFIGDMLGWYHFVIQCYAPVIVALEEVIDRPTSIRAQSERAKVVLAWVLYAQGFQYLDLGYVAKTRVAAQQCGEVAALLDKGDAQAELFMLSRWLMAWTLFSAGDIVEARLRFEAMQCELERAAVEFTFYGVETGRKFWLANVYNALALSALFQGRYADAEAHWLTAIALREELGEQRFLAFNLFNYAQSCILLGRDTDALHLAQRGLTHSQVFGDQIGIAFGQMTVGIIMMAQARYVEATAYFQQSLAIGRQSGHRLILVRSLLHLGRIALTMGDTTAAQAWLEEASGAAIGHDTLSFNHLPEVINALGALALARREWDAAAQYFRQSLRQAPHCPAWLIQDARLGLAQVLLATGREKYAQNVLHRVAASRATSAATRAAARHLLRQLQEGDAAPRAPVGDRVIPEHTSRSDLAQQ